MTNGSQPDIPRDVPWKLAATTMELQAAADEASVPSGSSIAVFTHVPGDELPDLDTDYPDDKLVYLRFALSISPDALSPEAPAELKPLVAEGLPVWSSVVDIRMHPKPDAASGFRPYFLSAHPVRQTMVETAITGVDRYEGASDALSIRKSGSIWAAITTSKISRLRPLRTPLENTHTNFGVTRIEFTGAKASINNQLIHSGVSTYVRLRLPAPSPKLL